MSLSDFNKMEMNDDPFLHFKTQQYLDVKSIKELREATKKTDILQLLYNSKLSVYDLQK